MISFFEKIFQKYTRADDENKTYGEFYFVHAKRIAKHVAILIPLTCLQIAGILPVGIALLFMSEKQKKLPWFLRWFDNADQYVGRDTSTYYAVCERGYWARLTWLTLRNPLNYFGYVYLGFQWPEVNNLEVVDCDYAQENVSDNKQPGFYYAEVKIKSKEKIDTYYEYYGIWPYLPFWRERRKENFECIRYRLGWKIGAISRNHPGDPVQWVCVLTPFKTYKGILPEKYLEKQSLSSSRPSEDIPSRHSARSLTLFSSPSTRGSSSADAEPARRQRSAKFNC